MNMLGRSDVYVYLVPIVQNCSSNDFYSYTLSLKLFLSFHVYINGMAFPATSQSIFLT